MNEFDNAVNTAIRAIRRAYAREKESGNEHPDWEKIVSDNAKSAWLFDSRGRSLEEVVREELDKSKPRGERHYDGPVYFGGKRRRR